LFVGSEEESAEAFAVQLGHLLPVLFVVYVCLFGCLLAFCGSPHMERYKIWSVRNLAWQMTLGNGVIKAFQQNDHSK